MAIDFDALLTSLVTDTSKVNLDALSPELAELQKHAAPSVAGDTDSAYKFIGGTETALAGAEAHVAGLQTLESNHKAKLEKLEKTHKDNIKSLKEKGKETADAVSAYETEKAEIIEKHQGAVEEHIKKGGDHGERAKKALGKIRGSREKVLAELKEAEEELVKRGADPKISTEDYNKLEKALADKRKQIEGITSEVEALEKKTAERLNKATGVDVSEAAAGAGAGKGGSGGKPSTTAQRAANDIDGMGTAWNKAKKGELFSQFGKNETLKNEAWGEMGGMFSRRKFAARIAGNTQSIGGVVRLAVGGGSAAYFGSGLVTDGLRLVGAMSPKKDPVTGQDQQIGFSNVAIDALGTGAGIVVMGLGGKGHAMGTGHW